MITSLVVPTIRENSIKEFLPKWQNAGFDSIIIVEDNPTKTMELSLSANDYHVCWEDIDNDLKEKSWIISRRDSAIRSYGFLLAHRLGAKYIFTLDDDCYPLDDQFVAKHVQNLEQTPKWIPSIPGHRTRGLPYQNFGIMKNVMLSVGLWEGVPDYDAIQTLSNAQGIKELPEARVMPLGQYFPICGMNMCFRPEIMPLMYFPLMGEGQPYRRFDDIWFGIIAKRICDHLGYSVVCGRPNIHHAKASNPFVNLVREAPGIVTNEVFWEIIDKIELKGKHPTECMNEIGFSLMNQEDVYFKKLGGAMVIWSNLFTQ